MNRPAARFWAVELFRAVGPDRAPRVLRAIVDVLDAEPSALPWLHDDAALEATLRAALAELGPVEQPRASAWIGGVR